MGRASRAAGPDIHLVTRDARLGDAWRRALEEDGWSVLVHSGPGCPGVCPDAVCLMDARPGSLGCASCLAVAAACRGLLLFFGDAGVVPPASMAQLLETGAADFLPADVDLRVLRAKLRAVLRRARPEESGEDLLMSPGQTIRADRGRRLAWIRDGGKWASIDDLTELEHRLLCAFLDGVERIIPRRELFSRVWGERASDVNEETLTKHVERLRRKLGRAGAAIRTRYGRGYQLVEGPR